MRPRQTTDGDPLMRFSFDRIRFASHCLARIRSIPRLSTLFMLGLAIALAGCGGDAGPTTAEDATETAFRVSPQQATSGTAVRLEGLSRASLGGALAFVGTWPAPLLTGSDGTAVIYVPSFLDPETLWPTAPAEPVEIVVTMEERVVARSSNRLEVLPLQESAGAATDLLTDYGTIARAMTTLSRSIPVTEGAGEAAIVALGEALDSLTLEGEKLLAELAALTPEERKLVDALQAAMGGGLEVSMFADDVDAATAFLAVDPVSKNAVLVDEDVLALAMQFSVYVKHYGDWYITGIANDFSTFTSNLTGGGWGSMVIGSFDALWLEEQGFIDIPIINKVLSVLSAIGAYLTIQDYVLNTFVIALFPTEIDELKLTVEKDMLLLGDTTDAKVHIKVSNNPPPVTMNDYFDQLVLGLSLIPGASTLDLKTIFYKWALFFLNKLKSGLENYDEAHPDVALDIDFYSVPDIEWEADITDPKYLGLVTGNAQIVSPLASEINWRASDNDFGTTAISVTPSSASDAILVPQSLGGIEYNAGAFGEDIFASNEIDITVQSNLVMTIDFAQTISADGFNALEVRAGYLDNSGDTVWTPGINVTLTVDGGEAAENTGATDADGQFITLVSLLPGFDQVIVGVTVSDAEGNQATGEVQAVNLQVELQVEVQFPELVSEGVETPLTITANFALADDGNSFPASGAEITIDVEGGIVTDTTAVDTTDFLGHFHALATLGAESDSIVITITATDTLLGDTLTATEIVTALRLELIVIEEMLVLVKVDDTVLRFDEIGDLPVDATAQDSDAAPCGPGEASMKLSVSTGPGGIVTITAEGSAAASSNHLLCFSNSFNLAFQIPSESRQYTFSATGTEGGRVGLFFLSPLGNGLECFNGGWGTCPDESPGTGTLRRNRTYWLQGRTNATGEFSLTFTLAPAGT